MKESSAPRRVVVIYSDTMQGKKIKHLQEKGGRLLSCEVKVGMPDGAVAMIDDWGRVTWSDPAR